MQGSVGVASGVRPSGAPSSEAGLVVAPQLRLGDDRLRASLGGWTGPSFDGSTRIDAYGSAIWPAARVGSLLAEVGVDARAVRESRTAAAGRVSATAKLLTTGPGARGWIGGSAGRLARAGAWTDVFSGELGGTLPTPIGAIRLSARSTTFGERVTTAGVAPPVGPDTMVVPGPALQTLRSRSYVDAEAGLRWAADRLRLDVVLGARAGDRAVGGDVWVRLDGAYALRSGTELLAALGVVPGVPELGTSSAPVGLVGVRLAFSGKPQAPLPRLGPPPERRPGSPRKAGDGLQIHPGPAGATLLRLWLAGARQVEVSGDFTDWSAVRLARAPDGAWEAAFALTPGTYRISVRVDGGAWTVPPGIVALPDEFAGSVGIFVVAEPSAS